MAGLQQQSDQQLTNSWRAGNPQAGAVLFQRYYPQITHFFTRNLGPDRDDLVQATFLACIESVERFREDTSFRSIVFAIARNKLLKHWRDQFRDHRRFTPDASPRELPTRDPSILELMLVHAERELLAEALAQLPTDTRRIIELHYWSNFRIREISQILELPIGTVKVRLHRGRQQLTAGMTALSARSSPSRSPVARATSGPLTEPAPSARPRQRAAPRCRTIASPSRAAMFSLIA